MSYAAFPVNDVLAACANYNTWRNDHIRNQRAPIIERTLRRHRSGLLGWFHRKMGHTINREWVISYLKNDSLFSSYNVQDIADWGRAGYIDNLQSLAELAKLRGISTVHVDAATADRLRDFWPRPED